jgi:hypothetical protein
MVTPENTSADKTAVELPYISGKPNNHASEEPDEGEIAQHDLTDEEADVMLDFYEQLVEDYKEIGRNFKTRIEHSRQEKAGEQRHLMMSDRSETLRCLEDIDPNIREIALSLAIYHWRLTAEIADRCEQMSLSDSSATVRGAAIIALGECYRGQQDRRIGAILAKIVSAPDLAVEERKSAYLSLVVIHGDYQRFSIPRIMIGFPKDLDWEFVNSYLLPNN